MGATLASPILHPTRYAVYVAVPLPDGHGYQMLIHQPFALSLSDVMNVPNWLSNLATTSGVTPMRSPVGIRKRIFTTWPGRFSFAASWHICLQFICRFRRVETQTFLIKRKAKS
jgi:hypothetical protein